MPPPPPPPRALLTDLLASLPAAPSTATSTSTAITAPAPTKLRTATDANTNTPLPIAARPLLLTLHVLFPTEFLPALDLLDRGLVTRFRIREGDDVVSTRRHGDGDGEGSGGGAGVDADPSLVVLGGSAAGAAGGATKAAEDVSRTHLGEKDEGGRGGRGGGGGGGDAQKQEEKEAYPIYHVRSAQPARASRHSTSVDTTTAYEVRLRAWNCSCPAFAFAAFPAGAGDAEKSGNWDEGVRLGLGGNKDGWNFGGLSVGAATPPVCKHLLACVLVEQCELFKGYAQEREVSVEEAAGWAAGWGD